MTPAPLHTGPLHGFEAVFFYLLAFGPFVGPRCPARIAPSTGTSRLGE